MAKGGGGGGEPIPLSRFGALVAQLESVVASAKQKTPDALLCFDLLSELSSAIDEAPKETIQLWQRKCEDALQSLLVLGARRPVRRLASSAMGRIIEKGDVISVYSRASNLQGWLVDVKRAEAIAYAGAAQCLGEIYRLFGDKITAGLIETSSIVAKLMKYHELLPAQPPWSRLEGQVVLVTGASSGIGRDFCLDLARSGCRVVAAARRADRLRSLCDEINASAAAQALHAVAVELDVAAGGPVLEAAVQRAWDAFGRIDALINNAGIRGAVHSLLDWPEDEWDRVIKTNLTGSWLVAKHVCRRMRDAKLKGSVVNITSIAGLNRGHLPGSTGYASSKAAVHYATKIMALELGAYGIRVNSIAPGLFKSEITAPLFQKRWLSTVASKIVPLKEHGATDPALTSLVRFLIHEASSYVTGNIFIVDSGATIPGVPIFSSL